MKGSRQADRQGRSEQLPAHIPLGECTLPCTTPSQSWMLKPLCPQDCLLSSQESSCMASLPQHRMGPWCKVKHGAWWSMGAP